MALQFIMGNSGSGKSHYLYQKVIKESKSNPGNQYLVIVPEQFTMQTQKDLVRLHPDGGIMNIDVLSFQRLAHRVFEEVGADQRTVLTETGKNLMIRKVAIEEQDALQVLGSRMNRPGYVSEVKSILSELMQYEVTDFEMEEFLKFSQGRPLLHAKLEDLRTLYGAFLRYQRDRFLKPEEILDVLCQAAPESDLLKKSVLAFDGFAGFTPSQLRVLEELLVYTKDIWMTVTIAADVPFTGAILEHELFAPSKRLIKSVQEAAMRAAGRKAEMEDAIVPPVILGRDGLPRFRKDGALFHLEQNLFRGTKHVFEGDTQEVSLHTASTPVQEIHYAARTISRLVTKEGLRYRDIAVITGNMEAYHHHVKRIFDLYHIPVFLDETRHILLNPCLEFVRGALTLAEYDFSCETVFRFLRTGMAGLQPEEVDRIENYVLAAGIRGKAQWEKMWEYLPYKMTEDELENCNAKRILVMDCVGDFADAMTKKGSTLRTYANALYDLLLKCSVQQWLKDREISLQQEGLQEEAREYSQIYRILIGLLDEMVDLLGDEPMDAREFAEILDAGLDDARVGVIPPGVDQVQVGDIRRSRLSHVKYLFFLGVNDGWVPSRGEGGGIVSDSEREILKETGIELAPSTRENSYIQRFYLYQNLTKPQQHLSLSWCLGSGDGTAMRPSYLIAMISHLFPALEIIEEKEAGTTLEQVTSKENGMLFLTGGLQRASASRRELDSQWETLYRIYREDGQYRERVRRLLDAAFAGERPRRLSFHTSRELYGDIMTNSVTRLEQFASCAFAHFALYGLQLQERELYGVRPADLGIVFHRSMELFARRVENSGQSWIDLKEAEQKELMGRCVEEVAESYGANLFKSSARAAYTVQRLKRILCRSAWALQEQLAKGSFRPTGFEVSFADVGDLEAVSVSLKEQGEIRLRGRIDRVDTAEKDDNIYVKIIDYKSGMTQFDPVSLYYGLQLQLVVYMNAALEMEQKLHPDKNVLPAGIFYYHMQDPILEKEAGISQEKLQEKLMKKLRPDGIVNSSRTVIELLDHDLTGDSAVIPAGLKKDGSLKAASSVLSTEQFSQLSGFVKDKLCEMGGRIREGEILPSPGVLKNRSACDYCAYSEVCGFDRKLPWMKERRLPELSKQAVFERIQQEQEKEGGRDHEVDNGTTESH